MRIDIGNLRYSEIKEALAGVPVSVTGFSSVAGRAVLEVAPC